MKTDRHRATAALTAIGILALWAQACPAQVPAQVQAAQPTAAERTGRVQGHFRLPGALATAGDGVTAPVVVVGLGTEADFLGRDVKGKTVMIYSLPTPGGRDHSADWSGAVRRANDAGAAIILVGMGFPGNAPAEPEGARRAAAPTPTLAPAHNTQDLQPLRQNT